MCTLECLINMPTQISMSGGKKSKKLIRVLVPNKHVWWKNPKFTGMNFGTDTIIDFLNIGRCFTTLVVLYTQKVGVSQPLWYCILCRADWCFTTLVILYILSRYMFHNPCGTVYSAGWCFTTLVVMFHNRCGTV